MRAFEDGEIEDIMAHCEKIRTFSQAMIQALQHIDFHTRKIDEQCRVWDFRNIYGKEEESDD